jgi:hypothetical protein
MNPPPANPDRPDPPKRFQPRPIDWLWYPYIARGKLTLLDGDPGVGKSLLAIDLAARLDRRGPLPDGQALDRCLNTLYISADDICDDTLFPRLYSAGVVNNNVRFIDPDNVDLYTFPAHTHFLASIFRRKAFDLLVIDPIAGFMPAASSGSDAGVRQALLSFVQLAIKLNCAIILIRHLTKIVSPRSLYRGLGSIGLMGVVRSGLLVARHPARRSTSWPRPRTTSARSPRRWGSGSRPTSTVRPWTGSAGWTCRPTSCARVPSRSVSGRASGPSSGCGPSWRTAPGRPPSCSRPPRRSESRHGPWTGPSRQRRLSPGEFNRESMGCGSGRIEIQQPMPASQAAKKPLRGQGCHNATLKVAPLAPLLARYHLPPAADALNE